ncbi:hypothetical protein D3C86_2208560 [compost metagenome]
MAFIEIAVMLTLFSLSSALAIGDDPLAILVQENHITILDTVDVVLPRGIKRSCTTFAEHAFMVFQ